MTDPIVIKQGDTRPVLLDTLTYSDGTGVDLTGASVLFVLRPVRISTSPALTGAATITSVAGPATVQFQLTTVQSSALNPGRYVYAWAVTFPNADTMEFPTQGNNELTVEESLSAAIGRYYCSVNELRDELGIADNVDDALLTSAISAATEQIEDYCGRAFWQSPDALTSRLYNAVDPLHCEVDDISTATGLMVMIDTIGYGSYDLQLVLGQDFVLWPLNSFTLRPVQPATELHVLLGTRWYFPAPRTRPSVQVTAQWGWPAVPDSVNKACIVQAAQLFKSKDAPFGVAGFTEFGVVRLRARLHPIAEGLLDRWRKDACG